MLPNANPSRSRWVASLALLGVLGVPTAAHAGFEITYVQTNSDGEALVNDWLTPIEMSQYLNQASCQCGEKFAVRIFLNNSDGTGPAPTTRVMTYVGTSCDDAQNAVSNFPPCVQLTDLQASEYDDQGLVIVFDQVYLSSGTNGANIPVSSATPVNPCPETQTGTGKVWICVDEDQNSQCLGGEFVTPTILNNTDTGTTTPTPTDGTDGGQTGGGNGITYDYLPPLSTVSGFTSNAGDGKVVINWERTEVNDISGFRVLCADQSGQPGVDGLVTGVPTGQSRTNGKLYYTPSNLCEDPVYGSTPDTGDTGDTSDDGRDTDVGTTGDATTGGSSGTDGGFGTGTGTDGGLGTDGSDTGFGTGTDTGTVDLGSTACDVDGSSPLCSLDWSYVCSEHIPAGTITATVNGLRNDEPYDFLVVAYDTNGNPRVISEVLTETPIRTNDFWELCEQEGDICGNGGFCHCRADAPRSGAWLGFGLLMLGVARRRRRR